MFSPQSVRLLFMGTSRFAVPALEMLAREGYEVVGLVSQPVRPAGRGRRPSAPPAVEAAERLGVPVLTPEKVRSPEVVAEIERLRPELIVVAAYAQFLPRSILHLPPRGCLNLHGSLLPRWRGASPMQAALLAGDEFTGVTIMEMAPAMDSGPMLGQSVTRIEDSDTTSDLEARLSRMGAALLLSLLPDYLAGAIRSVSQDEGLATYAPIIAKEAGLIDWSEPAVRIWRSCRAYRPWPGAYTRLDGRVLKLLSCALVDNPTVEAEPGTVVALGSGKGVGVVTGDGVLRLMEVALEGGRPTGGYEFTLGHRHFIGSRLG